MYLTNPITMAKYNLVWARYGVKHVFKGLSEEDHELLQKTAKGMEHIVENSLNRCVTDYRNWR